jgi:hypothetical protein
MTYVVASMAVAATKISRVHSLSVGIFFVLLVAGASPLHALAFNNPTSSPAGTQVCFYWLGLLRLLSNMRQLLRTLPPVA